MLVTRNLAKALTAYQQIQGSGVREATQKQWEKRVSSSSAGAELKNSSVEDRSASQGSNLLGCFLIASAVLGVGAMKLGLTWDTFESMKEEERRVYGYEHDANESIVAIANPNTLGSELGSHPINFALHKAHQEGVEVTLVFPDPNDLDDGKEKVLLLSRIEHAEKLGLEVQLLSGHRLPFYGDVLDGEKVYIRLGEGTFAEKTFAGESTFYLNEVSELLGKTTPSRLLES